MVFTFFMEFESENNDSEKKGDRLIVYNVGQCEGKIWSTSLQV